MKVSAKDKIKEAIIIVTQSFLFTVCIIALLVLIIWGLGRAFPGMWDAVEDCDTEYPHTHYTYSNRLC